MAHIGRLCNRRFTAQPIGGLASRSPEEKKYSCLFAYGFRHARLSRAINSSASFGPHVPAA